MKKLSLVKVLGVFSVFYSSDVSFADPDSMLSFARKGESQAMFSLMGNINQQNVTAFKKKIQALVRKLEEGLNKCDQKGRVQLKIAYLLGLVEIVDKVFAYQRKPTPQLQLELTEFGKTYGGEVRELIWSVLHPAPAVPVVPAAPVVVAPVPPPPPPPQPAPDDGGDE